jgi:hypothetical protein
MSAAESFTRDLLKMLNLQDMHVSKLSVVCEAGKLTEVVIERLILEESSVITTKRYRVDLVELEIPK